jgi:hypothetical protein
MTTRDMIRTIVSIQPAAPWTLAIEWSDATRVTLNLEHALRGAARRALRDPANFRRATIDEWGHAIQWPFGTEISAERLWLETLSATGRSDARDFLEWRLRHGLSLSNAAEALGLSRRMVAYYSNGEKPVPRSILLACKGWEVSHAA